MPQTFQNYFSIIVITTTKKKAKNLNHYIYFKK